MARIHCPCPIMVKKSGKETDFLNSSETEAVVACECHHDEKQQRLLSCVRCEGLFFVNKYFWRKHVFTTHGKHEREEIRDLELLYDCRYCPKQFGLKVNRNAHLKTHPEWQEKQAQPAPTGA